MFSGLTNQMSSLLSTVKGGSTDQEGVAAADPTAATSAGDATHVEEHHQAAGHTEATTESGEHVAGDEKQR